MEQGLYKEPRPGPQSLGRVVQQGPDIPRVLDRLDGHGGVEILLYTEGQFKLGNWPQNIAIYSQCLREK